MYQTANDIHLDRQSYRQQNQPVEISVGRRELQHTIFDDREPQQMQVSSRDTETQGFDEELLSHKENQTYRGKEFRSREDSHRGTGIGNTQTQREAPTIDTTLGPVPKRERETRDQEKHFSKEYMTPTHHTHS